MGRQRGSLRRENSREKYFLPNAWCVNLGQY